MKPGEQFDCPYCGKASFLKKESVMDGWTKKGEVLKCASCSAKMADILPEEPLSKSQRQGQASSKLASLLGAEAEAKPKFDSKPEERRFCRDCGHLVSHPFLTRCSLHSKDVNPMDDCPDFKPKAAKG